MKLKNYISDLFLPLRFYIALGSVAMLYLLSFFLPLFFEIAAIALYVFIILAFFDYLFLFVYVKAPTARRIISERLSNGEDNNVKLTIQNRMRFPLFVTVIDELPVQLQERGLRMHAVLAARERRSVEYIINPTARGEYHFGNIMLYLNSALKLVQRRVVCGSEQTVKVFPAFSGLGKYHLLAEANLQEHGTARMRKIGHSMEFEQVKDYVRGDDIRNINWKATARRGQLMINSFADERSRQVYCVIDKGRLMKMPFGGLSLLDYSINATLALTNVCLQKQDRVGLISFSSRIGSIIAADRKPLQRENIMQVLYGESTGFPESDFEMLYLQIRKNIKQRSLLMLFTNFESLSGLQRQMAYLRSIAKFHLLMVVFFENTELTGLAAAHAETVEDVYVKTVAEKLSFEKRLVVKELQKHGIISVLAAPQDLTLSTINKYLELKKRNAF